jgi:hypothetical protein
MRKLWLLALLVVACVVPRGPARAWEYQGHELVGAIADALLANSAAGRQMKQILGAYTLNKAAMWADCVRAVRRDGTRFEYRHRDEQCAPFESVEERARMEDYARRNWDNCDGGAGGCHTTYHYADVARQHDHYSERFVGTFRTDIVQTLGQAIRVLQTGQPVRAPVDIRDAKEALLIIAHLAGDMHQPLHVGALYLRRDGTEMNPDQPPGQNHAVIERDNATRGGNEIIVPGGTLHHVWDALPEAWGVRATPALLAAARAVTETRAQLDMQPRLWASETIRQSRIALDGLAIQPRSETDRKWPATSRDPDGYRRMRESMQREQVVKAGLRLAELLNDIWSR